MAGTTGKKLLSNEEFIRVYHACTTIDEVAEKAGITRGSANARASKLRRVGIPMRKFKCPVQKLDAAEIARLKAIAEECQGIKPEKSTHPFLVENGAGGPKPVRRSADRTLEDVKAAREMWAKERRK